MIYSWFTHYKWWFSIVMLDCQRVYMFIRGILTFLGPISQLWLGSIWWIWARAWTTFSQHTHYTHIYIYTYTYTYTCSRSFPSKRRSSRENNLNGSHQSGNLQMPSHFLHPEEKALELPGFQAPSKHSYIDICIYMDIWLYCISI